MCPCQISVIIPCHNDGRYLTEAIESVLSQESPVGRMEVIVVDDHSSDLETLDVLSHLKNSAPRVRVLQNTGRLGCAAARNLGVASAKGEWIAFLDADDVWLPGGLKARWHVVETEPEARWICADFQIVREDRSLVFESAYRNKIPVSLILRPAFESGKTQRLPQPVRETIADPVAWTSTVMIKKPLFLAAGGFDESLYRTSDTHLWVRLALETDLFFVPQAVAHRRWHKGSLTWHRGRANMSADDLHLDTPLDWRITAFKKLLRDRRLRSYHSLIHKKLTVYSAHNIYYYWCHGGIWPALRETARALTWASTGGGGWRNLLGAVKWKSWLAANR